MNEILKRITDDDAKKLYDTIVEIEACQEMYNIAKTQTDYNPAAFKALLDYYMHALKVHKALWKELLIKYLGEKYTSENIQSLRYDPVIQSIFQMQIEGCKLCK